MKTFKRIAAWFMSAAIVTSSLAVSSFAELESANMKTGDDITLVTPNDSSSEERDDVLSFDISDKLDSLNLSESYSFATEDFGGISTTADTRAGNRAPIAGLTNMVANPDTVINGNMTTETIMYWLWNDGQTDYTYDPDGDEITDYYVDGITDYILGDVTIGDTVVGFATKITLAAEHELFFQVRDENGAYSNIVYFVFPVEPADGNQRPVCVISAPVTSPNEGENVGFLWSSSYDPDGDTLSSVRIRVYDETGTYENVNSSSDYYVNMASTGIVLRFTDAGQYYVWISLSDSKGAWSDWNVTEINVHETYLLSDVVLYSHDPNNTSLSGFDWMDFNEAIELAPQTSNPSALYNLLKVTTVPEELRNRTILDLQWEVSGYVKTKDGTPVSGATVTITVPMIDATFNAEAITNSNGYFIYESTKEKWYNGWGITETGRENLIIGRPITKWVRYGNYYTMTWVMNSTMTVSGDGISNSKSFDVVANAGSAYCQLLGRAWMRSSDYPNWEAIS